jgi:hypothetical protein
MTDTPARPRRRWWLAGAILWLLVAATAGTWVTLARRVDAGRIRGYHQSDDTAAVDRVRRDVTLALGDVR